MLTNDGHACGEAAEVEAEAGAAVEVEAAVEAVEAQGAIPDGDGGGDG